MILDLVPSLLLALVTGGAFGCGAEEGAPAGPAGDEVRTEGITLDQAAVGLGPYYLDRAGATYVLTEDIVATGSAFVFAARGVTLDLGGHRLTFGTAADSFRYGVAVPPPFPHVHSTWSRSDITRWKQASGATVRNGTIVQPAPGGAACAAFAAYGQRDITVADLEIVIAGDDTFALRLSECAQIEVRDNVIRDRTRVVTNRHAGRAAIDVMAAHDGRIEIRGNQIEQCRQWGIRVKRRSPATVWGRIHANTIQPATIVTNGYAIGVHGDRLEVYENQIAAENGRGIHVELCDEARVYDNEVTVTEVPRWGEYSRVSAHGIKLEACTRAQVHGNTVTSCGKSEAADAVGNGAALVIGVKADSHNEVRNNTFAARHLGGAAFDPSDYGQFATAIEIVGVEAGSGLVIEENTFVTEDRFFTSSRWHGRPSPGSGGGGGDGAHRDPDSGVPLVSPADASDLVLRANRWRREATAVPTRKYDLFFMDSSVEHLRFVDNEGGDFRNVGTGWPWLPCAWSVAFTGRVETGRSGGAPIPYIPLEIRDARGAIVATVSTNGAGWAPVTLDAFTARAAGAAPPGVAIVEHNPHRVSADYPGGRRVQPAIVSAPDFRVRVPLDQP